MSITVGSHLRRARPSPGERAAPRPRGPLCPDISSPRLMLRYRGCIHNESVRRPASIAAREHPTPPRRIRRSATHGNGLRSPDHACGAAAGRLPGLRGIRGRGAGPGPDPARAAAQAGLPARGPGRAGASRRAGHAARRRRPPRPGEGEGPGPGSPARAQRGSRNRSARRWKSAGSAGPVGAQSRDPEDPRPVGAIVPWPMPPALIIRQTPQVHDEVGSLLDVLRRARGGNEGHGRASSPTVPELGLESPTWRRADERSGESAVDLGLERSVVAVFGAARGIGAAIARAFAGRVGPGRGRRPRSDGPRAGRPSSRSTGLGLVADVTDYRGGPPDGRGGRRPLRPVRSRGLRRRGRLGEVRLPVLEARAGRLGSGDQGQPDRRGQRGARVRPGDGRGGRRESRRPGARCSCSRRSPARWGRRPTRPTARPRRR